MSNFKIATKDDVKNAGFIFVKDVNTQDVKKIATSADFQVGLSNLPKDLTVTGKAIFTQGISGSLTRLVDNTSYLVAGSNITITSASNGQVTIATTGAAIGDVVGPASATDNAIVRFNLTTGKLIQNSGVTIDDSNNITTAGDLAVNGGDLTSSTAAFNLLNSTVTTLNVGGAATTVELGAATGTTSINNALTVDGNTTLGNSSVDTVTVNGTATFAGSSVTTTFDGDIAVNGGDLTTTAATMNLVNAATTINLGSTAVTRAINIGTNATNVQTIGIGTGNAANLISIGSNAASTVSVNGGDALNLYTDGGTITIDSGGAGANAISIGTFGYAQTISVGNTTGATSLAFRAGSGGITFETNAIATGDLAINGGDLTTTAATMNLVNAATTINLGSTAVTRAINIGTNATNVQTIGIGTGNAANAITIGSNAASIVSINGGDALNLYADNGSLTIDSGTGNTNIGTFGYARTTDIATGAANQAVTLGSTHGGSSLTLNAGSGSLGIGTSQIARTITIGPSSANSPSAITHTVDIGYIPTHISAITNINIGTAGAGATKNVITIGNYSSTVASTTTIHGDTISIGAAGTGAQTIGIGTSASIRTTNIATGAAAQTVTLGSTSGASALTLDAGTGDVNIGTGGGARTTNIATTTTGTQTINIGTFSTNTATIRIGNHSSTVTSTTTIHGDELTLGTSGKKIGFFGTAPTSRTGAGLTTLAQLYTALRALGLLASA